MLQVGNATLLGKVDVTATSGLLFAAEGANSMQCTEICDHHKQIIALYRERKCFCADSLTGFNWKLSPEGNTEAFFTDYSLRMCRYVDFMDPNHPTFPQVGVVSAPGSGNTWTRSLLERLSGIVTGSIYRDSGAIHQNIYGGLEPWKSGRVTFVKSHSSLLFGELVST